MSPDLKVLYGSDSPISVQPLWYVAWLGWQKARELQAIPSPLEKAYQTMKAMGVPEEVFIRAEGVLRLARAGLANAGGEGKS